MNWNSATLENLRRVFREGFAARDVAEPLASFDGCTPASEARTQMEANGFDVVGIRQDGLVVGYVERSRLNDGVCAEQATKFDESSVISDATSLAEVVQLLYRAPRLFVHVLGAVGGIVTTSDLQKAPVRMWLFGMITLIEMRMGHLVEQLCEGESWKQFLSQGRLQKAADLLEERRRRSQNLRLIDCLQFSDKAQIIARNEVLRSLTRFTSRRQVEETCRALESLRNNLAHSQDILATDWETIFVLSSNLDDIIAGTKAAQAALQQSCASPSPQRTPCP